MSLHPFIKLAEKWPSTIVSREKVGEFSGGLLHPRTLANMDAAGEGPRERLRMGRKVAYPVDSLVAWMQEKMELIQNHD